MGDFVLWGMGSNFASASQQRPQRGYIPDGQFELVN